MNFDDIFRTFFRNFGPKPFPDYRGDSTEDDNDIAHPPGAFGWSNGGDDEDDVDDDFDPEGGDRGPFGHFGGGRFHGGAGLFSFDSEVNEMFRHFDEMFKNFGLADFPPLDVPRIEQSPTGKPESLSPRDHMLKEPDEEKQSRSSAAAPDRGNSSWFDELRRGRTPLFNPSDIERQPSTSKTEDSDLDDVVRQGEMDRMFGDRSRDQPASRHPGFRSFSRSISIQTVRKPDGTVESTRTERDDKGNVTTTVTSSQDGMPGQGGNASPWKPSINLPGWRRRDADPIQRNEKEDSLYDKFFGSWFKN